MLKINNRYINITLLFYNVNNVSALKNCFFAFSITIIITYLVLAKFITRLYLNNKITK